MRARLQGRSVTTTRLWVFACGFAGFVLAGLTVGRGQAPAPGTQKPAPPPAQAAQATQPPPLLHALNLIMLPDEPVKSGNNRVYGSASQPGFYIVQQRFAPNQINRPHYSTMDRWITVITGTWYSGKGKVFRPKDMIPLPPGSVMYYPAHFVHYDGNQDGTETIGQIMGYGPVQTVQAEEDEQGNPISRGGEGAGYAVPPPASSAKPTPSQK
jgi:hypothetical protein